MTRRWENAAVESQIERRRRVITGSIAAWGYSLWRNIVVVVWTFLLLVKCRIEACNGMQEIVIN